MEKNIKELDELVKAVVNEREKKRQTKERKSKVLKKHAKKIAEAKKRYRKKHKEKVRAYQKQYRDKHREYLEEYRQRYREKHQEAQLFKYRNIKRKMRKSCESIIDGITRKTET